MYINTAYVTATVAFDILVEHQHEIVAIQQYEYAQPTSAINYAPRVGHLTHQTSP